MPYHVSSNYNDAIVSLSLQIEWKDVSAQFHFINNDNARQFSHFIYANTFSISWSVSTIYVKAKNDWRIKKIREN